MTLSWFTILWQSEKNRLVTSGPFSLNRLEGLPVLRWIFEFKIISNLFRIIIKNIWNFALLIAQNSELEIQLTLQRFSYRQFHLHDVHFQLELGYRQH